MITEADTCRKYVLPRLLRAGWDDPPRSFTEQRTFTDGRIVVVGSRARRGPQKRADYLLQYTRDFTIAVVEAKAAYKTPGTGLQQAKDYAEILGLNFAYATNGHGIVEFDYLAGLERELDAFPTPEELWERLRAGQGLDDETAERLLTPSHHLSGKSPRYYQEIAVNKGCAGHIAGAAAGPFDHGDRDRKDDGGFPNLLEAMELPVEPYRGAPAAADPVPGRSERSGRRP